MGSGRGRVIAAVPSAGTDDAALGVLATLDPVEVARVAVDASEPWWRRRTCARSLVGRVPSEMAGAMWACVIAAGEVTEVRREMLGALVSRWVADADAIDPLRDEAMAWLRGTEPAQLGYGMEEAVVLARSRLGDLGVAFALATLVYDPWWTRYRVGAEALAALVARRGRDSLLRALGSISVQQLVTSGATAPARFLGLELTSLDGDEPDPETLFAALHDHDIVVAQHAARLLHHSAVDERELLAVFDEHRDALEAAASAPPPLVGRPAAAAWALFTAARRSYPEPDDDTTPTEPSPELLARLDAVVECEVPMPDVPRDVRRAILAAHLPGQRGTDPRHRLEGLRLDRRAHDAEPKLPRRARAALVEAGLQPGAPRPIGEVYGQGGGSYHLLDVQGTAVAVCTFGPFVHAEPTLPPAAQDALARAGFRVIDDELASRTFEGLCVYYFGDRDPLTVRELLMYWQD